MTGRARVLGVTKRERPRRTGRRGRATTSSGAPSRGGRQDVERGLGTPTLLGEHRDGEALPALEARPVHEHAGPQQRGQGVARVEPLVRPLCRERRGILHDAQRGIVLRAGPGGFLVARRDRAPRNDRPLGAGGFLVARWDEAPRTDKEHSRRGGTVVGQRHRDAERRQGDDPGEVAAGRGQRVLAELPMDGAPVAGGAALEEGAAPVGVGAQDDARSVREPGDRPQAVRSGGAGPSAGAPRSAGSTGIAQPDEQQAPEWRQR